MAGKEFIKFEDSCILEGITSVRALLEADADWNDRRILEVLYDEKRAQMQKKELGWMRHRGEERGFSVRIADSAEIDRLALGNTHGGLIALCSERTIPSLEHVSLKENGFYLMLEGIEDPYNFGYSLRSAYAMGVDAVVLSERNWMSAAGIVARSSAGASERLRLFTCAAEAAPTFFHRFGYRVVCADLRDSASSFDANLKKPLFLIVGGERRGISRSVLEQADLRVRIDYGRCFDAALSAASAATMLSYEVLRQNRDDFPQEK